MSIRDQDIMVLHRTIPNPMLTRAQAITTVPGHTIPNPMVIRAQAITTLPRHTIPNPMVIRAQAITTLPRHTIPNPMVIRAQVGKWLPSLQRPWQQNAKDEFRFRTGDRYLGRAVWEHYLGFEQGRTSSRAIKLSMIRLRACLKSLMPERGG